MTRLFTTISRLMNMGNGAFSGATSVNLIRATLGPKNLPELQEPLDLPEQAKVTQVLLRRK